MDTGGYGVEDTADLTDSVAEQIKFALGEAELILFVVDVQTGLVTLDEEVARLLRGCDRPVILVANKADSAGLDADLGRFERFQAPCASNGHADQVAGLLRGQRRFGGMHPGTLVPDVDHLDKVGV